MIQHTLPVRSLQAFFRALCRVPSRLAYRSDADVQTERREPPRESVFRSLTARREPKWLLQ